MSSNYDTLLVESGVTFPEFPLDGEPWEYSWQTKTFPDSCMRLHRLGADGFLYRMRHDYDDTGIPKEVAGGYDLVHDVTQEGVPVEECGSNLDNWQRVRFYGTLRVISARPADSNELYDLRFEGGYELESITYVEDPFA